MLSIVVLCSGTACDVHHPSEVEQLVLSSAVRQRWNNSWKFGAPAMTVCWKLFAGQRLYQGILNFRTPYKVFWVSIPLEKREKLILAHLEITRLTTEELVDTGSWRLCDVAPNVFHREICLLDLPLERPSWKSLQFNVWWGEERQKELVGFKYENTKYFKK